MAKNKLLLISPAFPPPLVGGSKVWTYNMVENSGGNFDILTSELKDGEEEIVSSEHNVIRSKYLWDSNENDPTRLELIVSYLYIIFYVLKTKYTHNYDVIVAGAFDFANGIIFLLGKILNIKVVGLGNAEEFTLAIYGSSVTYRIKRKWMYLTHKWCDGFIVVCDYCGDILRKIGVTKQPIFVVPSCIDPKKVKKQKLNNKKKITYNVLSVGRIVERKGFHDLIEAVAKLKNTIPEIKLTIVGNGPYKFKLEELIKKKQLENYVYLAGNVEDLELARIYSDSDLFVLAHRMLKNGDTEGCPTVFSEAGGQGIPLIGGDDAGASTAIDDGVNGFLVDCKNVNLLADTIKKVLLDNDLRGKMSAAAIKKVKKDHLPKIAGDRFYNAVMSFRPTTKRTK